MNLIRQMNLTASEAKELSHLGFVLKLMKYGVMTDVYNVYVLGR